MSTHEDRSTRAQRCTRYLPYTPLPWHTVHADFTGNIPGSVDTPVIRTFIDALTRYVVAVPTANSNAETAGITLVNHGIAPHGLPVILITDNGPAFISAVFQNVCTLLDIRHLTIATYAPQSNGSIERQHQTLKTILAQYASQEANTGRRNFPSSSRL